MTGIVADEVLGRFARQQHDWFERVRKGSLDPEQVAAAVQKIIDRGNAFVYDKRKDDWELLEDVELTLTDPANLEAVPFLKSGESSINGEEMVRRARQELRINLGQHDAEFLLEHQNKIPQELRKYALVFTGTVWRDPRGDRCVAYLSWNGERWILRFSLLSYDWGSFDRLVRPRE